jgi:formylglycine-generating enzyme required for sulfatase activity
VWEWCQDWYAEYTGAEVKDPAGPTSGSDRVVRGGSWGNGAPDARSAARGEKLPGFCDAYVGCRFVLRSFP